MQLPETLVDYLVMNAARRVIESEIAAGTPITAISRDLVASKLYGDVVDNTSVADDDTEDSIKHAVEWCVAAALPDADDATSYQRRTLGDYLGRLDMAARRATGPDTKLLNDWHRYYHNPIYFTPAEKAEIARTAGDVQNRSPGCDASDSEHEPPTE